MEIVKDFVFLILIAYLLITEQTKLKNIVFNCENLSSLEILQQFNRHVSALAPKEDDLSGGPKTKLEKKALNKGGRR